MAQEDIVSVEICYTKIKKKCAFSLFSKKIAYDRQNLPQSDY